MKQDPFRLPLHIAALALLLFLNIQGCTSIRNTESSETASPPLQSAMPSIEIGMTEPSPLSPMPLSPSPPPSPRATPLPTETALTPTVPPVPSPLNEEVTFEIVAQFDPSVVHDFSAPEYFISPEYDTIPQGTQYLIGVDVPCGVWVRGETYAIMGELTEFKWHLAEYDALIQRCLRDDVAGNTAFVQIANSQDSLINYFDLLYDHYYYVQSIAYPQEVEKIHILYLSYIRGGDYLEGHPYSVTTPYYRQNSVYNSYGSQKQITEANYQLFNLMDQEGVRPLLR